MNTVIKILKKSYKLYIFYVVAFLFLGRERLFPNADMTLDQLLIAFLEAFYPAPFLYMYSRRVDFCFLKWKLSKGVFKRVPLSCFWARFLYTKRNQTDMSIIILLIQAILFPLFWINVARFVASVLICFRLLPIDISKWSLYFYVQHKVNSYILYPIFIGILPFKMHLQKRAAFERHYWPRFSVFNEED